MGSSEGIPEGRSARTFDELDLKCCSHQNIIDHAALRKLLPLQKEGEEDIIREMIELYLKSTPGRLVHLENSIQVKDAHAVAFEAHALWSTSLCLGAVILDQPFKVLESFALNGFCDELEARFKLVQKRYKLVETEFHRWVGAGRAAILA